MRLFSQKYWVWIVFVNLIQLISRLVPEDVKDVKVGSLIALFVEEGQDWRDVEIPSDTSPAQVAVEDLKPVTDPVLQIASATSNEDRPTGNVRLQSPTARNLLHHFGIDVSRISASGPKDTLLKEDVLNYIKVNNLKPKSDSGTDATQPVVPKTKYIDIELTNMRKIIAKRLTLSKTTIPHSFMTVECTMDEVSKMRKELKSQDVKVSVNDFIIKAAAISLYRCPHVNVRWNEHQQIIEAVGGIDISIAVATPNGLITPIVKNAESLSIHGVAETVKELSKKAKEGKLQPHEFQGGSFSISNLGMFGIKEFSAVINPPQAAILAVGRGMPTFNANGQLNELMRATLSYDSRVIDEEVAAEFMETFSQMLSEPSLLEGSPGMGKRLSSLLI